MLLNSDIQKIIIKTISQFQKEINVIIYIIDFIFLNLNHFIWTKFQ